MVKTLGQLYQNARRQLKCREDSETASFMARTLVCHITGKTREQLLAGPEIYICEADCEAVEEGVQRLLADEPLAYVLGEWDFYGMTLKVNKNVLIPRDDTCAVTDLAIGEAKKHRGEIRVLDLCTGSGCIGLAVAKNAENTRVTLADISRDALAVAKQNIVSQKLSARVSSIRVDALEKPPVFLGQFDIIVSNPPYIPAGEMESLQKSVGDYEPHLALQGGEDGLDFYRSIAKNYRPTLKNGGVLCFEFGMGQGDDVCRILEENGYTILERTSDNNNIERAVSARYQREDD